jgi:hypothetical protein
MPSGWTYDTITPHLREMEEGRMKRRIETYLEYETDNVQTYMRENASWTDRTGAARQGLFANRFGTDIVVFHTVPYGIWLEVRWSGKYAIIVPTIKNEGRRIMRGIRSIMK